MLARVLKKEAVPNLPRYLVPEISGRDTMLLPEVEDEMAFAGLDRVASLDPHVVEDFPATQNAADQSELAEIASSIIHADIGSDDELTAEELPEEFEARVDAAAAELRRELSASINKMNALSARLDKQLEKNVVDLALQIAKKIVRREVTIDREIAMTLVKVSLAKLHNRSTAKVHLHPDDLRFVEAHTDGLDFRGTVEFIEDRTLTPGGCLIQTETGDIDGRIESQFDELAYGLLDG